MNLDLGEIRKEIDKIDSSIVELFEQRMKLTSSVAEFKIATGKRVFDREREVSKLATLKGLASNEFNATGVQELFQQIMSISRKRQYQLLRESGIRPGMGYVPLEQLNTADSRVVFQGVVGAYSHAAMKTYFPDSIHSANAETWKEAIEMVVQGEADFAVLPIENSTAGSVSDIYDLIFEYPVYIVAEQIIPIKHVLMGIPGSSLDQIRTVYSHPQGLAQCQNYLDRFPAWERKAFLNTAMAAEKVAKDQDPTQAAIASCYAAEHYGLEILEDQGLVGSENATRFIIIGGQKCYLKDAKRVSICIELPHERGSLYNIMAHLIYNGLNMTKIESRPKPGRNWEYRFFIDFEGNMEEPAVQNAILGVHAEAGLLKILGNY